MRISDEGQYQDSESSGNQHEQRGMEKKSRRHIRQNRRVFGKWKCEVIYCSSSGAHSQRDLPAPPDLHEVPRMYQGNQTESMKNWTCMLSPLKSEDELAKREMS